MSTFEQNRVLKAARDITSLTSSSAVTGEEEEASVNLIGNQEFSSGATNSSSGQKVNSPWHLYKWSIIFF